jgi:hypothetical protein
MKEFEMTEEQLEKLMVACSPRPAIMLQIPQISAQERANTAWASLGEEMGFKSETVTPVGGLGPKFFMAEPV